jgi:hypothetical protein
VQHRVATKAEQLNAVSDLEQKLSINLKVEKLYEFTYQNPFYGDTKLRDMVQCQTPFHPLSE